MENLSIAQLEDLIVQAEQKLSMMRPSDDEFAKQADLIDTLRGIRQDKLNAGE
jgi:hypothetical protein